MDLTDPALQQPALEPSRPFPRPTSGPVDLRDWRTWWARVPGASWRHPEGPASTLHGRDRHPVVQCAHDDALAYATWAGKALPSEAGWGYAARGGLEEATYCWGEAFAPKVHMMANAWQGEAVDTATGHIGFRCIVGPITSTRP